MNDKKRTLGIVEGFNDISQIAVRGERLLLVAMLDQALRDLNPITTHPKDWRDAQRWFSPDAPNTPFSLRWLADELEIDYDKILRLSKQADRKVNKRIMKNAARFHKRRPSSI